MQSIAHEPIIRPMTALCLACSSSLPPRLPDSNHLFRTPCCNRSICSNCLKSNPRLARYNPCLACLGGVQAVGAHAENRKAADTDDRMGGWDRKLNIDGGVADEDVFVLGEEDQEDEDAPVKDDIDEGGEDTAVSRDRSSRPSTPPPAYPQENDKHTPGTAEIDFSPMDPTRTAADEFKHPLTGPNIYHIQKGDTALGISLRFGIDGRTLCRLNNLPACTLSTTPHLLHTRTSLVLPLADTNPLPPTPHQLAAAEEHAARRAREQAAKRLQCLTKEADWRVAQAYVALADDPESVGVYAAKQKELGGAVGCRGGAADAVGARAVDQYLDDEEWEAQERASGRFARILPLPGSSSRSGTREGGILGFLWTRKG